jgi:hypothetical protein
MAELHPEKRSTVYGIFGWVITYGHIRCTYTVLANSSKEWEANAFVIKAHNKGVQSSTTNYARALIVVCPACTCRWAASGRPTLL